MAIKWNDVQVGDRVTYRILHQKGRTKTAEVARVDPPGGLAGKTGRLWVFGCADDGHRWDASVSITRVVQVHKRTQEQL